VIGIDTSAVIAVLQFEPEASAFLRCIANSDATCLSAVSLQEASMVLAGRTGEAGAWQDLDALLKLYSIAVIPLQGDSQRCA